jgi:hypothetical protein
MKSISVEDYKLLNPYFVNQPYRLSIYSLLSVIVWSGQKYTSSYTIEDGAVILGNEAINNPQDRYLVLPVNSKGSFSPEYLHQLARRLDYREYWFVPGDYLQQFDLADIESLFIVSEQPEYEDYIYLTDDLAFLKGNRFSKKRNLIHQFDRTFKDTGRVAMERLTTSHTEESLDFLTKWCAERDCEGPENESLACEKRALTTALRSVDTLEGVGLLIRIDGVVSALALASRLNDTTGVLNFEKAFSDIRGLYQFLDNECAKQLFTDYRYINKESDMGLPDLAHSKKSYYPVDRLKSYKLTVK